MKRKIVLGIIIVLIIALSVLAVIRLKDKKEKEEPLKQAKVVDKIEGFDYTINDQATKVFKDEFNNLKKILTEDEIDYDAYAISLSKLFVIDFYTLSNKFTKQDVGSLEYINKKILDNFKLKAIDTIYKYVQDNTQGKRSQELPEVKTIVDVNAEDSLYGLDKTTAEVEVKKVTISWDYVTNLSYDNSAEIIFIRDDQKLVLVDFKPKKRN